ncbi:MAG TPA: flagella basal body P-ring formation protein FlgA [Allosphingosinicella sp.]|nr:flagella basal body P-ring formation protein FlgA [Allosphingosinicella sp.]
MPLLAFLLAAAGASVTVGLIPAAEVALTDRRIRLADVADLSGLAPAARSRLAQRVLAVVPAGRDGITLSREALAALVRRSVPGLVVRTGADRAPLVFRLAARTEDGRRAGCAELARPLAAGASLSEADLIEVDCREAAASGLRFDRGDRVARAGRDLEAGAYLGRISAPPAVAVDKGAKLTLVATEGPVRVSREVVALQAGRPGGRLFVRDAEGNVTSAPLAVANGGGE